MDLPTCTSALYWGKQNRSIAECSQNTKLNQNHSESRRLKWPSWLQNPPCAVIWSWTNLYQSRRENWANTDTQWCRILTQHWQTWTLFIVLTQTEGEPNAVLKFRASAAANMGLLLTWTLSRILNRAWRALKSWVKSRQCFCKLKTGMSEKDSQKLQRHRQPGALCSLLTKTCCSGFLESHFNWKWERL